MSIKCHSSASSEAPIPVGYETIIDMYPMDFEEWLWANGIKDITIDYLKNSHMLLYAPMVEDVIIKEVCNG